MRILILQAEVTAWHARSVALLTFTAVVVMTLLASCVYGSTPAVKEAILTESLMRTVADCIYELPNQSHVGRAACILLCNLLAACDANVAKASIFIVVIGDVFSRAHARCSMACARCF